VRVLAPVLSFTCEEVWHFMPAGLRDAKSVHLSNWPSVIVPAEEAASLTEAYATVLEVREAVTKALEDARNGKVIGKSQEAAVHVFAPAATVVALTQRGPAALAELFIVAAVRVVSADEIAVEIAPASGEKCPRCWNLRELAVDAAHPEVCARCAGVLSGQK
jgi:isoleucyl-tRNA synthetase